MLSYLKNGNRSHWNLSFVFIELIKRNSWLMMNLIIWGRHWRWTSICSHHSTCGTRECGIIIHRLSHSKPTSPVRNAKTIFFILAYYILKRTFLLVKGMDELKRKNKLVYSIFCIDCQKLYIGETENER